jgi:Zn finger protein HypA/HybF involved in hydrogenase expression
MSKQKNKCEQCDKDAVIIEDKKYYCGECYCNKYNIKANDERTTTYTDI